MGEDTFSNQKAKSMDDLISVIRACRVCEDFLEPNPVLQASSQSKILVVGQAPGRKVHLTGIPWNDASGQALRDWLGVTPEEFYDTNKFAIVPMGFCYPGKGPSGDLPPSKVCAPLWHGNLIEKIENLELILLIGQYAQKYYLKNGYKTLTKNVSHYHEFLPKYFHLPHPSPRNFIWQNKNPWFKTDVLPSLKEKIRHILSK